MNTLPPELRSMLLDLARRVGALQPGNVRRFTDERDMIAHQLRQLAHGVVNGPKAGHLPQPPGMELLELEGGSRGGSVFGPPMRGGSSF
jgi:hypothetical protein